MRVTILGSGSSSGVPVIGMGWGACDPKEPKNRRRRSGLLLQDTDLNILFDTGPDLRVQLLEAEITHLDAVIYTHSHADHAHGIDELRWICQAMNASLPVYANQQTFDDLKNRFEYCFTGMGHTAHNYYYKPVLTENVISADYQPFTIGNHKIIPFEQDHGFSKTVGYRIGKFAYSTDVVDLDERAFDILKGVDYWVLGCLQPREHQTHINIDKALTFIDKVKPKKVYFTHMNSKMDYQTVQDMVSENVIVGYDGLSFTTD